MNRLLAFYYGSHPDSHGRMLAEVLKQDDRWLEVCQNYIQWLFPKEEFSRDTPDAPILDKATRCRRGISGKQNAIIEVAACGLSIGWHWPERYKKLYRCYMKHRRRKLKSPALFN